MEIDLHVCAFATRNKINSKSEEKEKKETLRLKAKYSDLHIGSKRTMRFTSSPDDHEEKKDQSLDNLIRAMEYEQTRLILLMKWRVC